jgi:hypothetical protein
VTACLCRSAGIGDGPVRWHKDGNTARPGVDLEAPLRGALSLMLLQGTRAAPWQAHDTHGTVVSSHAVRAQPSGA